MRKAKLSKYVAVVTAIGIIAVSPMTALADTVESVKIEGNESEPKTVDEVKNTKAETGVYMTDKGDTALSGTVTVNGNVSVDNKDETKNPGYWSSYSEVSGVVIESDGGTGNVNISGDVKSDASQREGSFHGISEGVYTNTNSNITIGGNVNATSKDYSLGIDYSYAVSASKDYKVNTEIGGSVTASAVNGSAVAVSIQDKSTDKTSIAGDVKADGKYAYGILINNIKNQISTKGEYRPTDNGEGKTTEITVGGNVEANGTSNGIGIYLNDNLKNVDITVDGDIKGNTYGLYVSNNMSDDVKIKTDGTISSDDGAAIVVVKTADDQKAPEVTAWKIESGAEQLVSAKVPDESQKGGGLKEDTEYAKTVQSAINYIIKADATENGSTSSNGKIVLTGTKGTVTIGDKIYKTAHQNDTIIINVETAKGYKSTLKNNGVGTLALDKDGNYILTIPEGGGVELSAVIEKIAQQRSGRNSNRYSSSGSAGSSTAVYGAGISSSSASDTNWAYDNTGWKLKKSDGNYASSEWRQVSWNGTTSWYHFNNNGYAESGWFTDSDGQRYFLDNAHDGTFGQMFTGWKQINGQWYFFNTANTAAASVGSLLVNGTTPDGYKVNADGIWVQ